MPQNDRWRIVLIDDEDGIRRVTGITLEDAGYGRRHRDRLPHVPDEPGGYRTRWPGVTVAPPR